MSPSVDVDEINNIVRQVGGRSTDQHQGFPVGQTIDPVSRHYTVTPEFVHYKTELFNTDVDRTVMRNPRRTCSNSTQSTQSTRQSSIFDDTSSSNSSAQSSMITTPSTHHGIAADIAAHRVAAMPGGAVNRLCCEFAGYIDCKESFALEEFDAWIEHIVEHLRDQLPPICLCWFCDDFVFDTTTNGFDLPTNFRARMWHIRTHISDDHYNVDQIRPDFYFLSHIHSCGLISNHMHRIARTWTESQAPVRNDIYEHNFIPQEQIRAQERSQQIVVSSGVVHRKRENNRDPTRRSQPRSRYRTSTQVSITQ